MKKTVKYIFGISAIILVSSGMVLSWIICKDYSKKCKSLCNKVSKKIKNYN